MEEKMFDDLIGAVKEMGEVMRGERKPSREFIFDEPDVVAIRKRSKASQSEFAAMLGISLNTLRNWEQGRRKPEGPARVLLRIADCDIEAVREAAAARPTVRKRKAATSFKANVGGRPRKTTA